MSYTTKIIFIASIGFIIMGVTYLKSEKVKKSLRNSGLYKDADGFIKFNGVFNISIGFIGVLVGVSDYFFSEISRQIVTIFGGLIILLTIIQNMYSKRYKK